MGAYYDEIEIEDMAWDPVKKVFHYPCPCGDRFEISKQQLRDYEDVAVCPSCSLVIRVVYDPVGFFSLGSRMLIEFAQLDYEDESEEEDEDGAEDEEEGDEKEEEEFLDAMDNLSLNEKPSVAAVAA